MCVMSGLFKVTPSVAVELSEGTASDVGVGVTVAAGSLVWVQAVNHKNAKKIKLQLRLFVILYFCIMSVNDTTWNQSAQGILRV